MIEYENLKKLNEPFFAEYAEKFKRVCESGWYILGEEVRIFESSFAKYCNAGHCIGVANGLDALIIALKVFSFKAGDEIIVPSNTYIATILSVLNCGLKPVLVEPRLATYNIDPEAIEAAITPKTKAIMVVHLYGKCCEMERINDIASRFNLRVIEDCAQAHGANIKGKKTGTFGDLGAFSFYPTKNLGALGDGGCLTTNGSDIAERVKMYRNYGSQKKYYNEVIGINSRLDEVQAAFLSVKLQVLDKINEHKNRLASIYSTRLKDDFIKPVVQDGYYDVYHIYNIRHPRRDQLKSYLDQHGVKTEIHYPVPPHKQNAMSGILSGSFPISEEIHATTLSLPVSYFHKEEQIHHVVDVLNKF